MNDKQIKSKERVTKHGEVFTSEREVKAMCDLVKDECERIDAKFLEPACGEGVFLVEILKRKLNTIKNSQKENWLFCSYIAISTLYGIDIMKDNCEICRNNLFNVWLEEYKKKYETLNEETIKFIKLILSLNIICGNTLSTYCVDENQKDTDKLICFSDWKFVNGFAYRKEFTLKNLLNEQQDLFTADNDKIYSYKIEEIWNMHI